MELETIETVTLVQDVDADRNAFHAERATRIGSSDISAIAGLNKFRTPVQVWAEKTGVLGAEEENDAMWLGRELEPVVAKMLGRKETGWKIVRAGTMLSRKDLSWAVATPDYYAYIPVNDDVVKVLLEIKTAGQWAKESWAEGIPDHAHCQVQWQMGVSGVRKSVVAALIGGRELVYKVVDFDQDIFDGLVALAKNFMDKYVTTNTMPPAVSHEDGEIALKVYGYRADEVATLPDEAADWIGTWQTAEKLKKVAKAEVDKYDDQIKEAKANLTGMLKGAGAGMYGNVLITNKETHRKEYLSKATSYWQVKMKEVGGEE